MRIILAAAIAGLLVGCSNPEARQKDQIRGLEPIRSRERPAGPDDPEILAAVTAVPDLAKFKFRLLELDMEGEFAIATLETTGEKLDPLTVLLKREGEGWRVLDYGTTIGDPREFGVPDRTAKSWGF